MFKSDSSVDKAESKNITPNLTIHKYTSPTFGK